MLKYHMLKYHILCKIIYENIIRHENDTCKIRNNIGI